MSDIGLTVNLNKASYVRHWWYNGRGVSRSRKPAGPTASGTAFCPDDLAAHTPSYPGETMGHRAERLGILDSWTFHCRVIMSNGHPLEFRGKVAEKIFNAWRGIVYGRRKEHSG